MKMSVLKSVFGQQTRCSCARKKKMRSAEVKGINLSLLPMLFCFFLGFLKKNLCINEDGGLSVCTGPAERKGCRLSTFPAFVGFLSFPQYFRRFSSQLPEQSPDLQNSAQKGDVHIFTTMAITKRTPLFLSVLLSSPGVKSQRILSFTVFILHHKRATSTISKGSMAAGVCVCLQHACMSNSEMGGGGRDQAASWRSLGLSQLISSRARPQTGRRSSREPASEEKVSLMLQRAVQSPYLSLSALTLSDLTPGSYISCVCM